MNTSEIRKILSLVMQGDGRALRAMALLKRQEKLRQKMEALEEESRLLETEIKDAIWEMRDESLERISKKISSPPVYHEVEEDRP